MSLSKTCNVNNNERSVKSVDVSEWLLMLHLPYLLTLCVDKWRFGVPTLRLNCELQMP